MKWQVCFYWSFVASGLLIGESLPPGIKLFLQQHCHQCHAGRDDALEGGVRLDINSLDWESAHTLDLWTTIHEVVESGDMPPEDADAFPAAKQRKNLLEWLEAELVNHAPPGGTLPRRLNRVEYQNTIRDLFDDPEFELPPSFPSDVSNLGFDNVASGLVMSPPLMAQYLEIATAIANEWIPEPTQLPRVQPRSYRVTASDLNTDEGGGGKAVEDAFRLVSSRNMASAAGWTGSFEAPYSGTYQLKIDARTFQTDDMFYEKRTRPFQLQVYARQNGQEKYARFSDLRLVGEVFISAVGAPSLGHALEIEMDAGEILGLRWADGPVYSDPGRIDLSHSFLENRLLNDRAFYAAALELNGGKRGSSQVEFYEAIRELMEGQTLDLSDPALTHPPEVYGGGLFNGPHNWCKAYAQEEMHRQGPALDVLGLSITGPNRVMLSQKTRDKIKRSREFLGRHSSELTDVDFAERFLRGFLSKAFRSPVEEGQLSQYVKMVQTHRADFPKKRIEDALHLAVRKVLISPQFLFREIGNGRLGAYELASRLSYFLNGSAPDDLLMSAANTDRILQPEGLEAEARRLLQKPGRKQFVKHFTGQWLATRKLKDIMPDPRLLKFYEPDRQAMIEEVELFFDEMLHHNRPLKDFIDPGFSFRNKNLNKIYGGTLTESAMQRVSFPKGGNQGGLLGMAAIMMATANGVDTHPVHRGVWLLENVLGQPTAPPPPGVPAIAPDTSGARSMREQMARHASDSHCARCHQKIDPLGFVMETFDPVGRWREHYPIYTEDASQTLKEEFYANQGRGTRLGPRIDASATLADGTVIGDVRDLKAYLLGHMDLFTHCLIEKLMVYSLGRKLSFGDRRVLQQLTAEAIQSQYGLQDVILAVILSDSFKAR